MNQSTSGLRAIARNSATSSQVITSRVTAIMVSSAHAAITSAITAKTVRTLKRTTRSWPMREESPQRRTASV